MKTVILRVRLRGGMISSTPCRFFVTRVIALKFCTLSKYIISYILLQKSSKSVHGARRTIISKLTIMIFPCFSFVFPIGRPKAPYRKKQRENHDRQL